jgi:hypothetical protein
MGCEDAASCHIPFEDQCGASLLNVATMRPLRGLPVQDHPQTEGWKVLQSGRRGAVVPMVLRLP